MSLTNRPLVRSLLTVVFVLLLGIITILSVAYRRHQHLEDQRTDLQRNFYQQESQIKDLKVRLEGCDTVLNTPLADTAWSAISRADSVRVLGQLTR